MEDHREPPLPDVARMRRVRQLFDALCELPAPQWQAALDASGEDPAVLAETRALLQSQADSGDHVQRHVARLLEFAQDAELGAGDSLGPWRLLEEIGAGGMGKVFLAERADGLYQRQVAIKLLKGVANAAQAERLQFERQVLAGLQLPNIARLYDGGSTPGGHPYLVMEFVRGIPLDAYCKQHDLTLEARISLFLQMCDTVRAAHERLVVHCDLKPANVLVDGDGVPVLLDFGVARLLGDAPASSNQRLYTPAYAAPELVEAGTASVRADVFSLGVILLELITDRPRPRTVAGQPLPVPSAWTTRGSRWQRRLRGDLDAIAARACALDPAQRYPSVDALATDLRLMRLHRPVQAREGERGYAMRRLLRRNWQAVTGTTLACLVVAAFIASLVQARKAAELEARSAREISNYLVDMFDSTDPRKRGQDAESPLTARDLLDAASQRVNTDLRHSPLQRARLQAALGRAYQNLGVRGPAEQLLRQAADTLLARESPADRRDAARVHALLALEEAAQGNGAAAVATTRRGSALLGNDAAPAARAWLAYARGMATTGAQDFVGGEAAFAEAQALLEAPGADEEQELRFRVQYQIALLHWRRGRPGQAEQLYRQLLARTPPARTSLVHDLETRLGQVLRAQGQLAEARRLLENGMVRARALYGEDSRFVLLQHEALADLYWDMGDYPAAQAEFVRLLPIVRMIEGEASLRESQALFNYAELLASRGNPAAAEPLFRQALEIRRRRVGPEAPIALRAESGYASFLLEQGRAEEARPLLAHADAGLARQLPAEAPARLEATMARVRLHIVDGEAAQARALFDRMRPPSPSPRDALWLMEIEHRVARGEADAAQVDRVTREGLAMARATLGDQHIDTARWRLRRARALHDAGASLAAMPMLAAALPVLEAQLAAAAAECREARSLQALLARR